MAATRSDCDRVLFWRGTMEKSKNCQSAPAHARHIPNDSRHRIYWFVNVQVWNDEAYAGKNNVVYLVLIKLSIANRISRSA